MERREKGKPAVLSTYGAATPRSTPSDRHAYEERNVPRTRHETTYGRETAHERETMDKPAHGMAVASLVFGVLGFIGLFIIGPILALVFGYSARSRIKDIPGQGGDGFAVAGIVLGWIGLILSVVAAVIAVVALDLFVAT